MMINGMARCFGDSCSPGDATDRACDYLRKLGYRWDANTPLWIALMAVKVRDKRWPAIEFGRRVMRRVYATAGYPPALMPRAGPAGGESE